MRKLKEYDAILPRPYSNLMGLTPRYAPAPDAYTHVCITQSATQEERIKIVNYAKLPLFFIHGSQEKEKENKYMTLKYRS